MKLGVYTKYKVFCRRANTNYSKKIVKNIDHVFIFTLPVYSLNGKVDEGKNIFEQYICFGICFLLLIPNWQACRKSINNLSKNIFEIRF